MEKYDVVIVGGGIAGLGAAYEAKKQGLSYLVLEAQPRAGGRIHSHTLKNGLVVELGGEWIGKTHTALVALSKELGLAFEDHTYPDLFL